MSSTNDQRNSEMPSSSAPSIVASSDVTVQVLNPPPKRDARFWLVFLALCMSTLLSALDLVSLHLFRSSRAASLISSQTSVSTALPTIIHDLHGSDFVWVGSAYALSSTAFLPMSGGLAQIFGRRPVMLVSLVFFALGSAISGAAQSMGMLIAGRSKSFHPTEHAVLNPLPLFSCSRCRYVIS